MPSSKKQRGRQRKASATAADMKLPTKLLPETWRHAAPTPKQMMMGLRQGDNDFTRNFAGVLTAANIVSSRDEQSRMNRFRQHLLDEGIIQLVLDFLVQCENSEVRGVMSNTPTPLFDPSPWLSILVNMTLGHKTPLGKWIEESEHRNIVMHIARDFGPVVKCMCNMQGIFFQNKKHWFTSVYSFVFLVMNLADTRDAIPILLQYRGLIEFMVQSMFWESHRPDIVEESSRVEVHSIKFQGIAGQAKKFISQLIHLDVCSEDVPDKSVRRCLNTIGTARIAGRKSELYVMYLIARIKLDLGKAKKSEFSIMDYNFSFCTLNAVVKCGCVDKDVIAGVIDLAKQKQLLCDDVIDITSTMVEMLVPGGQLNGMDNSDRYPFDNLLAYAVDQGLIEVLIWLLVRLNSSGNGYVLDHLESLSRFALSISMSMKSSKAFVRQRSHITKELERAKALTWISQQCQGIFRTLKFTMHLKDSIERYAASKTCRCCGKVIIKDEMQQCGLCMNALYCSRMCQEEDWECRDGLGHRSCCQDRHLNALEKNIHDVVNKLVAENKQNCLAQATLVGYDILDCVVLINLRNPAITLAPPEDARHLLSLPESCDSFKKTIDHNRSSGYMTSMCSFYSCRVKREDSVVIMKHKLTNDSWQAAHTRFKSGHKLGEIGRDRRVRDSLGPFFCDWYEVCYLTGKDLNKQSDL